MTKIKYQYLKFHINVVQNNWNKISHWDDEIHSDTAIRLVPFFNSLSLCGLSNVKITFVKKTVVLVFNPYLSDERVHTIPKVIRIA